MGEQLRPIGTFRPERSRPRRVARTETTLLEEETTLEQH
jgi:hypothetical protein